MLKNRNLLFFLFTAVIFQFGVFAQAEVIFESNFDSDTGYSLQGANLWNTSSVPKGWTAAKAVGQSKIEVIENAGIGGSNALYLLWDPDLAQPTISLGKHLTGDQSSGYDELYIRYQVKLSNNFKAGDSSGALDYWKWGRLWQNTGTSGGWTENREDSFYVVWNFNLKNPYTQAMAVWSANEGINLSKGSAGGERYGLDHFVSGAVPHLQDGYFEHVGNGAWNLNWDDRFGFFEDNSAQVYHTLEYRFKLATALGANDGVFEMWWDGEKQSKWTRIRAGGGAPDISGIPTIRHGSGFNFFVFFDNMSSWNADWDQPGVEGGIFVDNIVVSTTPIGTAYVVGGSSSDTTPPSAPAKLKKSNG